MVDYVDIVASEKVKLVTLSVIYLWDATFDSFGCAFTAVLRVFSHNVIKYAERLDVDEFHEFLSVFE